MIQKLHARKYAICQLVTILLLTMSITAAYGQTPPPAPEGNMTQYFCSSTSWLNAGFTDPGDTFEELYLYGEDLSFYENLSDIPASPIANPSSYILQDGATYYVTQTVGGVESDPLIIEVTDRECGCFKNPDFETYEGQPELSSYTFYTESVDTGHKTCGGTITGATVFPPAPVDTNVNGTAATLVTPSQDPNVNINKVNTVLNPYSDYTLRLNDSSSGEDVAHLEKDFVAGEVLSFNYAFVFNDSGGHPDDEQPYVNIALYDQAGNLFAQRCLISQDSDCILQPSQTGTFFYTDWSCLKINTLDRIGQPLKMIITSADCTQVAHQGYVYLDDFFVGNNVDDRCNAPGFGFLAIQDIEASSSSLDCVVPVEATAESCGAGINASVPFPIEVCGVVNQPISNTNPALLNDLEISIVKNGNLVGTLTNPVINGDQFCFTITESDINVTDAFGLLELSTQVEFTLDCGDPYTITLSDSANVDICPTANCVAPLNTCDNTSGNGIGTFDLTQVIPQVRGTDWTAADVDITFYETEMDANNQNAEISSPASYDNTTPFQQDVFARLDWHPQGTPTSCFYIIRVELNVFVNPVLDIPDTIASCGPGGINTQIIATPTNITELQNVTYTWKRNGQLIPFSGSSYMATEGGTYEVTVSEENCTVTETVEVEYVEFEVDLGDDLVDLCGTADDYTITANVNDVASSPTLNMNDITYLWSTGETTKSIDVSASGIYTVDVTYRGCTVSNMVDVNIGQRPEVDLGTDQVICANSMTQIQANISNFQDIEVEFTWYLDGGVISGEQESTIDVTEEGTYKVEVNQIGSPDCIGQDEINVEYYENAGCVITQGLSPDTTPGQNDCLDLAFLSDRTGIKKISLFNRYGRIIFEEKNYVDTWCGQDNNGNDLPTGTYYYVIELAGEDPVFGTSQKGWIYLNREVN